MIIGVSGPYGSGKSEVVQYLAERSFSVLSLSDVIREELRRRGEPESRDAMIRLGNSLRSTEGDDVLAKRLLDRIFLDRNYVVDSVRHPAEVEALRSAGQRFRLLWIDADARERMRRLQNRNRPGDPRGLEELRAYESREQGVSEHAQQLARVKELADVEIRNEGSLAELYSQLQGVLQESLYFERPGWDEYFMNIARVVSTRSNCVKRHVAAVITLDRRIISTGYNGTPRGVRNCHEGGCPRCNAFDKGGTNLSECLCSHAEENAITQAAYHGVRVSGGTLFSTLCPCLMCTKMIINAGLKEVVFSADYPMGQVSLQLLNEANVGVRRLLEASREPCRVST